jgi:hypothetical protein
MILKAFQPLVLLLCQEDKRSKLKIDRLPNQTNMKPKPIKWLLPGAIIFATILVAFAFTSNPHSGFEPVLMTRDDMEAAVQVRQIRDIERPGKIWVYDNFIFVIEQYKGIHILDNTDPQNPKNLGFIQIDGCTDVAVNNGIIYANNAVDLIGVKPSPNFSSVDVVSRNRNVLPELSSPEGWYNFDYEKYRPENTVIVRWEAYKSE